MPVNPIPNPNPILKSDIRGRLSYRIIVLILLLALAVFALFLSIVYGSTRMNFPELLRALFIDTDSVYHRILVKIRIPRALTAGLVGACLAVSGTLLQGVMRNPLASPGIIGVSSGAGLFAVTIFILFPNYYHFVAPAAFVGAVVATFMVYSLSWKGGASPLRLVLSGIAVSSFLGAGTNALMIFFPDRVHNVIGFMVGSLTAVTWQNVHSLWPYALAGVGLSCIFANRLNILSLGDDTATALGLKVERTRVLFIVLASLLAAAAVSVVGLLGFVGLIIPHLIRLIIGNNARYLIPASALGGTIVLLLCDTLGRVIIRPRELPVGIIMALLGAPFFLFILRRGGVRRVN